MRLAALALLLAACAANVGGDDPSAVGSALGTARPPLPILENKGGTVLSSPVVYTVVWQGDEAIGAATDRVHAAAMANRSYWDTLSQYGVTTGTAHGVIVLPIAPPATLDDMQLGALIDAQVDASVLPAPSEQTIYALVPSRKTVVSLAGHTQCATGCGSGGFDGWHWATLGGHIYTVDIRCAADSLNDDFSTTITHELAEAVTDPSPGTQPAWIGTNDAGEIADMCNGETTKMTTSLGEQFVANNLYSNAIVASGKGDPCAPDAASYFGVTVPALVMPVDATGNGQLAVSFSPFAEAGIAAVNWTVKGYVDDCASTKIELQSPGTEQWLTELSGSATVGTSVNIAARITGAADYQGLSITVMNGSRAESVAAPLTITH